MCLVLDMMHWMYLILDVSGTGYDALDVFSTGCVWYLMCLVLSTSNMHVSTELLNS